MLISAILAGTLASGRGLDFVEVRIVQPHSLELNTDRIATFVEGGDDSLNNSLDVWGARAGGGG